MPFGLDPAELVAFFIVGVCHLHPKVLPGTWMCWSMLRFDVPVRDRIPDEPISTGVIDSDGRDPLRLWPQSQPVLDDGEAFLPQGLLNHTAEQDCQHHFHNHDSGILGTQESRCTGTKLPSIYIGTYMSYFSIRNNCFAQLIGCLGTQQPELLFICEINCHYQKIY